MTIPNNPIYIEKINKCSKPLTSVCTAVCMVMILLYDRVPHPYEAGRCLTGYLKVACTARPPAARHVDILCFIPTTTLMTQAIPCPSKDY